MPREIAVLAQAQLKAWQDWAVDWPVFYERMENQLWCFCLDCRTAIYPVTDRYDKPYKYAAEEIQAQLVAHLRNRHRDWEDIIYRKAGLT